MSDAGPLFRKGAELETVHGPDELMSVVGLFAGIGGVELGLGEAGHNARLLCEIDDGAQAVLRERFPGVELVDDVRNIGVLPECDLLTAGFPCQDLSQAGRTAGITGEQSGLYGEVFRMLDRGNGPTWLLFENVPFMLQLSKGRAISVLTEALSERGYRWAYRILDTRSFGLPQRRRRVFLLASRDKDPRAVLLSPRGPVGAPMEQGQAFGFYWTEGVRGLGWAVEAVPTLKGGSTIGIPSPPAIWWKETNRITTPDIRDAERLQGFEEDWTLPAVTAAGRRKGHRWKLVGNAVTVPVASWIGERFKTPEPYDGRLDSPVELGRSWPNAAWGDGRGAFRATVSEWPLGYEHVPLREFLKYPGKDLSARASAGFLKRTKKGSLRFKPGFIDAVQGHYSKVAEELSPTAV